MPLLSMDGGQGSQCVFTCNLLAAGGAVALGLCAGLEEAGQTRGLTAHLRTLQSSCSVKIQGGGTE